MELQWGNLKLNLQILWGGVDVGKLINVGVCDPGK